MNAAVRLFGRGGRFVRASAAKPANFQLHTLKPGQMPLSLALAADEC